MGSIDNVALPKDSLVLVTAANSLLGSNIADQFLAHGYRVRGAVRDPVKHAWLQDIFDAKYGKDKFSLVKVPDMDAEGAYSEVAKGADAIVHVASNLSFSPDPNVVIPSSIDGAINALKAAYEEPSVKRFVYTSSSSAAAPIPTSPDEKPYVITKDTWNESQVKAAWAEPPYEPTRGGTVYAASKTQAEQAVWKYHKENQQKKPELVVNAVLPNMNFGPSLDKEKQGYGSSSAIVAGLWKGEVTPFIYATGDQYHIDVRDCGLLHVAAAILPDVQSERIFGFGEYYTWNKILAIMRKAQPTKTFPDDVQTFGPEYTIEPRARAEELLQKLGRPGFRSLEESILATGQEFAEAR